MSVSETTLIQHFQQDQFRIKNYWKHTHIHAECKLWRLIFLSEDRKKEKNHKRKCCSCNRAYCLYCLSVSKSVTITRKLRVFLILWDLWQTFYSLPIILLHVCERVHACVCVCVYTIFYHTMPLCITVSSISWYCTTVILASFIIITKSQFHLEHYLDEKHIFIYKTSWIYAKYIL